MYPFDEWRSRAHTILLAATGRLVRRLAHQDIRAADHLLRQIEREHPTIVQDRAAQIARRAAHRQSMAEAPVCPVCGRYNGEHDADCVDGGHYTTTDDIEGGPPDDLRPRIEGGEIVARGMLHGPIPGGDHWPWTDYSGAHVHADAGGPNRAIYSGPEDPTCPICYPPDDWPTFAGMLLRGDPAELRASLPEHLRPPPPDDDRLSDPVTRAMVAAVGICTVDHPAALAEARRTPGLGTTTVIPCNGTPRVSCPGYDLWLRGGHR